MLQRVATAIRAVQPFTCTFATTARFGTDVLWLAPVPAELHTRVDSVALMVGSDQPGSWAVRDLPAPFPGSVRDRWQMDDTRSGLLTGRVALVTGSTGGIGAAIAELFAAEGAHVVVHGRNAEAAERTRSRIEAAGGIATVALADLTVLAEVEALREQVERDAGPVGVLVANAGGNPVPPRPVEDLSEQDWRATVDVNLTTTFFCLKVFLPGMKARGRGCIVTMSSAAARRPDPRSPVPYAAAKAGIELLTKDVAAQAGPSGVRANCIAPETIMTENNERMIPDQIRPGMIDMHPVRRLGTPQDVAHAALYLVADGASWVSGVVLDVAGGSVL